MKIQIQAPAEDSEVFIVDQALSKLFNGNLERAVSSIGAWFAGISAILDIPLPELNEVVGGQYEKGRITRAALLKHAQESGIAGLPPLPNWAAPAVSRETSAPEAQNGHSAVQEASETPGAPEVPESAETNGESASATPSLENSDGDGDGDGEDSGAVQEPGEVTAVEAPEARRKAAGPEAKRKKKKK